MTASLVILFVILFHFHCVSQDVNVMKGGDGRKGLVNVNGHRHQAHGPSQHIPHVVHTPHSPQTPLEESIIRPDHQTAKRRLGTPSNVEFTDFSVPHENFTAILKATVSAQTTDGVCHEPFTAYTPERLPALTPEGFPVSDCWIDRPDAHEILKKKVINHQITAEEAKDLNFFMENGYMILDNLDIDPRTYSAVDKFLDSVWKDHPSDLLVMNREHDKNFRPVRFSAMRDGIPEGNGSKILEAHAHNPALLALILNKKLHRYISLIYDDVPVATQSLFFRVGSSVQLLHRDPWYVQTRPPGNMMASWVALEDIHEGSGELKYIPGSHRLTYLPLGDSQDFIFAGAKPEDIEAHTKDMWDQIRSKGLKVQSFAPKKGQALIWHANLIHGGSASHGVNATKTRKSFVVHYDMLRKHGNGRAVYNDKKAYGTNKLLRHDCVYAFTDPMVN